MEGALGLNLGLRVWGVEFRDADIHSRKRTWDVKMPIKLCLLNKTFEQPRT